MPGETKLQEGVIVDSLPPVFKRTQSRRRFNKNAVRTSAAAVVTGATVEAMDFFKTVTPPFIPINYEGIPELGTKFCFTEEVIQRGFRVINPGDSKNEGFQGYEEVDGKAVKKPMTPPAGLLVAEQKAQGRNWDFEPMAIEGELSGTTEEKIHRWRIKEYLARKQAKKEGKPYDPRPIFVVYSTNGNDLRDPASDPELNDELQRLHKDGPLKRPTEFGDTIRASNATIPKMGNNIFNALMEFKEMNEGIPPEGETENIPIPIAGIVLLLTYDNAEVPTMQFIPVNSETSVGRRNLFKSMGIFLTEKVSSKVYNLSNDFMARWGAHLVSQDVVLAYKQALQKFMPIAGDFINRVAAIALEKFVKYNNGTEHPNPHGDYLISRAIQDIIDVVRKNGKTNKLSEITPKTHAL